MSFRDYNYLEIAMGSSPLHRTNPSALILVVECLVWIVPFL
jgi:hypothetical protein